MCVITKLRRGSRSLGAAALMLACAACVCARQSTGSQGAHQSTFDVSTLKYMGCKPGESKIVTATVTVTDENGRSASRSTKIRVNCEPPYERYPDLVFAKNDAGVTACSRGILLGQVAAAASARNYTVILIGHRAEDEWETMGNFGPQLDQTRALNAAAVLIGCGKLKPSSIRIDSAGVATNPAPASTACAEPAETNRSADAEGRVEVYLVPPGGKYLPENAKHLASLPPQMPGVSCEGR